MLLCTECGTQLTPDLPTCVLSALPTKTPLAVSHFLGRQCSSYRVPLHMQSTRFSGNALDLYLVLLIRILSWFNQLFTVAMTWLMASFDVIPFWWPGLRSLLHLSFHMRKVHSDMIIRKRQVAPWQTLPSFDLTFRRGRAMIIDMSMFWGQGMCFLSHISLADFHIWGPWFTLHSNRIWFIVSTISQFTHIPCPS